jgi:hypothetical protein
MSEVEARISISKQLQLIVDQSFASVLREIIFDNNNAIDFNKAAILIAKFQPEVNNASVTEV